MTDLTITKITEIMNGTGTPDEKTAKISLLVNPPLKNIPEGSGERSDTGVGGHGGGATVYSDHYKWGYNVKREGLNVKFSSNTEYAYEMSMADGVYSLTRAHNDYTTHRAVFDAAGVIKELKVYEYAGNYGNVTKFDYGVSYRYSNGEIVEVQISSGGTLYFKIDFAARTTTQAYHESESMRDIIGGYNVLPAVPVDSSRFPRTITNVFTPIVERLIRTWIDELARIATTMVPMPTVGQWDPVSRTATFHNSNTYQIRVVDAGFVVVLAAGCITTMFRMDKACAITSIVRTVQRDSAGHPFTRYLGADGSVTRAEFHVDSPERLIATISYPSGMIDVTGSITSAQWRFVGEYITGWPLKPSLNDVCGTANLSTINAWLSYLRSL
jgi:hypothetical protein